MSKFQGKVIGELSLENFEKFGWNFKKISEKLLLENAVEKFCGNAIKEL